MKQRYKHIFILLAAVMLCACRSAKEEIYTETAAFPETQLSQFGQDSIREETLGCNYYNERDYDIHV
ncbi:MAG: hypothetical protein J6K92_01630 [Oscillospiraceae bacterium]|nr:hypothetical protein [Oscillospiraceae bacterium]